MTACIKDFGKYLDPDKPGMVLKKGAPESAKKALEEYKKEQAQAKKRGEKGFPECFTLTFIYSTLWKPKTAAPTSPACWPQAHSTMLALGVAR